MQKNLIKSIQITLTFFFSSLFMTSVLLAATINLPKDVNGWTVFIPSDDSRICYVSTSGDDFTAQYYDDGDAAVGSDPFNPTGPINAYATFAAAYADTRSGYPDWILLKRGDTWTTSWGSVNRSGRAADEPFLIGSYGSSGNCPIIQTSASAGLQLYDTTSFLAVMGIDFYSHTRDPDNGGSLINGAQGFYGYIGNGETLSGLLIEGCKFRFYINNQLQKASGGIIEDVTIRRCLITDNYGVNAHSQGTYSKLLDSIIFEENILIHNGWYQQSYDGGQSGGQATQFNHHIYWASNKNVTIQKNIFIDASSAGIKLTGQYQSNSITIDNNLFIGNEVGISMGNNYLDPEYSYRFPNTTISNNVLTAGGRLNPTNQGLAWGFWLCGLDDSTISDNLLINVDSAVTANWAFATNSDESRDTTWSGNVVYDWGLLQGLRIVAGSSGSSNIAFNNNILLQNITSNYVVRADYDITSEWSFSGNTYYTDSESFYRNGSMVDLAGWNSWSGDTGTWLKTSFPDTNRDIDTYMQSIGETATIDAFIAACRAQDRYDWDFNYTAEKTNAWIRAGFFTNALYSPQNLKIIN